MGAAENATQEMEHHRFDLDAPQSFQQALQVALDALESGRIVAFPTDTVYGLGARVAHVDAVNGIYRLKGRPADKALPYLIPDATAAPLTFVNTIPRVARRLMDAHWPGALTLVLGAGSGVAMRVPDHPWLLELLGRLSGPVQVTSANRSGEIPCTQGDQVAKEFANEEMLLVDQGIPARGQASSLVRVDPTGPARLLREGAIPKKDLLQAGSYTVAFACTGNTCRSPMAHALWEHLLRERLGTDPKKLGWRALSFGVGAWDGASISYGSERALQRAGVAAWAQRGSRSLGSVEMDGVDRIYVMTEAHAASLRSRLGDASPPIDLLDPQGHVGDPFGGDDRAYLKAFTQIEEAIRIRLDENLSQWDGLQGP